MKYVIYTDLDGTLLDHKNYSFEAALPAVRLAQQQGIPIIPVTSKTRSEIEKLRLDIPLRTPFIVENGAAIFIPKNDELAVTASKDDFIETGDYFIKAFSLTRREWQIIIDSLLEQMPDCFRPFSKLSATDIADLTGLSLESSAMANEREFSDPLHWYGDDEQLLDLNRLCALQDINVVRGGRFVHLIKGADKGRAVQSLHATYKKHERDESIKSIALGDGGNDVAMLDVADIAICVRSKSHDFPAVTNSNAVYTNEYGPEGWCSSVNALLQK